MDRSWQLKVVHEAAGAEGEGYAMGWRNIWTEEGEGPGAPDGADPILWHFGCNFMYHCGVVLSPRRRMLVVTASNAGSGLAQMAARMALDAALQAVPHAGS